MNPQQFATVLRDVMDNHEASWNGSAYDMTISESIDSHCPDPWKVIVNILISSNYADIWEWCDEVAPLVKP